MPLKLSNTQTSPSVSEADSSNGKHSLIIWKCYQAWLGVFFPSLPIACGTHVSIQYAAKKLCVIVHIPNTNIKSINWVIVWQPWSLHGQNHKFTSHIDHCDFEELFLYKMCNLHCIHLFEHCHVINYLSLLTLYPCLINYFQNSTIPKSTPPNEKNDQHSQWAY